MQIVSNESADIVRMLNTIDFTPNKSAYLLYGVEHN
jgi:glutathionyl-hydroquinone reductase